MNKLILCLFVCSCGPRNTECAQNMFSNVTSYSVNVDQVTVSGYKIDTSGYSIDLSTLDKRIDKIRTCLDNFYHRYPVLTEQQMNDWQCLSRDMRKEFNTNCMVIKVVEPFYTNCSNEQHIKTSEGGSPAYADSRLCEEKGLTVTGSCPCVWRTAIQDDWVVITPPIMNLWDIVRAQTGCNNIWRSPLSECASEK